MLFITHFKNNELLYNFTCNMYLMHNNTFRAAAAKSLQSCPTLCDPIDGSPPRSRVLAWILQARTLEWISISFSNAWKWKVKVKSLSRVQLLATRWTEAYQAPPSMGFSRQKSTGVGCHCLLRTFRSFYGINKMASLITQLVKNLPAIQETWVQFLGQKDPLEKEMATHCSVVSSSLWPFGL